MAEGEEILHEADVDEEIQEQIVDRIGVEQSAIANTVAITGGESPTEAEFNALQTKVNAILAALRTANIIAP